MLVSIYGNNLDRSVVTVNGQGVPVNYQSEHQVNALLPPDVLGLARLEVANELGSQSVNIMVEPAVPAVFTKDGSGVGAAAAIRTGDYYSLFLTGLGVGNGQPAVTIGGSPVDVTYAGPAPGFPGLDQINIRLPAGTASGPVVVYAGGRTSNPVFLPQ